MTVQWQKQDILCAFSHEMYYDIHAINIMNTEKSLTNIPYFKQLAQCSFISFLYTAKIKTEPHHAKMCPRGFSTR